MKDFMEKLKLSRNQSGILENILTTLKSPGFEELQVPNEIVDSIFEYSENSDIETLPIFLRIVLKFLQTPKRLYIAANHLETTVNLANNSVKFQNDENYENVQNGIKILEILFEIDPSFCEKVVKLAGLTLIISSCNSKAPEVRETSSIALFKFVLFGSKECVNNLLGYETLLKWFMPLMNIYDNKAIKFFAYLTIIYLKTVCGRDQEIFRNGILDDVISWIDNEATHNFLLNSTMVETIDIKLYLQKAQPLLSQNNGTAQTLGAFLFCREVYRNFKKVRKIFYEIGAVKDLKRIALISNDTARRFAVSALDKLGEASPRPLSKHILEWSSEDVQSWLKVVELEDCTDVFSAIDGEELLKLRERDVKEKYFLFTTMKRNLFMHERDILMGKVDRSSSLKNLFMIKHKQEIEQGSCSKNSIAAKENNANQREAITVNISCEILPKKVKKKIDVFISYRRDGGSELASLLQVYLKFKKYKVFFDVKSLKAGNFGENLMLNVRQAKNFILILSPNSLNRCNDDENDKDWLREEIAEAVNSSCNIIPIAKNFDYRIFDDPNTPKEIRTLKNLNHIEWHHDTQVRTAF